MKIKQNKIQHNWSPDFAYAIGLIVTDGSLSKDGRHIIFTSKDLELVMTFQKALGIRYRIGRTTRSTEKEKKYYRVQIGNVVFYRFLMAIGLMPNKSKQMGCVKIPKKYFADFLRGHLDGDGSFYSYFDLRWKSSYLYYLVFNSASLSHIIWLQKRIKICWGLNGHITKTKNHSCISLKYAKQESSFLLQKIYYKSRLPCLKRKRLKILKALSIMPAPQKSHARVEKLVNSLA